MRTLAVSLTFCSAMLLVACGDETEPAEPAVLAPGGEVVTEDEADTIEQSADVFEETLPEDAQDMRSVEERTDAVEQQTDAIEEEVIE